MIRIFDILFSIIGILIIFPFFVLFFILCFFDTGSPIFFQKRLGKNRKPFTVIKFRTMKISTQSLPTHLVNANAITPLGFFLRKTKIDELPQLFNVLKGEMSIVGPRPCLLNQHELIYHRTQLGVFNHLPGITGLAQIKKVDMSVPKKLSEIDSEMLQFLTIKSYFHLISKTILRLF